MRREPRCGNLDDDETVAVGRRLAEHVDLDRRRGANAVIDHLLESLSEAVERNGGDAICQAVGLSHPDQDHTTVDRHRGDVLGQLLVASRG